MKSIGAMAVTMALLGTAAAQLKVPAISPIQSSSGQFVAFAAPPGPRASWLQGLSANTNFISLEPRLLVVSCERIKQRLCDQLGLSAPWRGKIYLNVRNARSADDLVTVVAQKSPGGWDYLVALPDILPRERFVRAIVQVLLSETANRNAGAHPAEIPPWLVDGLAGELRALSEVELFLPPPTMNVRGLNINPQLVNLKWSNPGEQARKEFHSRPPLTFEELSWPAEDQLAGDARALFSDSALLYVDSLLHLADGPACFRTLLDELPRHYNWQLAFLQAFRSHFQTPLDVEKWWALQVVHFTGRGMFDRWTPDESLKKLDETVRSHVEVRTGGNELPMRSEVTLQTVIREWDLSRQAQTLPSRLAELDWLRLRVTPDMMSLVDDYRRVLQTYLRKRGISGPLSSREPGGAVSDRLSAETISQLDELDRRREALRLPAK